MSVKPKSLILLDAHAIIHRAYHALPEFSTSGGVPTGALYGFSAMLMKIIADLKPDYIIACYDLPGKTFRHEAYDDYKLGRKPTEDSLKEQLELSRELCESFGIPIYDSPGFEADDMLGTIVKQIKDEKGISITIASGDMDALQLVDGKKVKVYTLKKGLNDTIIYDENAVVKRFGFNPELLPDYKGLRGDPSDNIPGIRGIGDKVASDLVQKFGSIEDIYKILKKDKEGMEKKGIKPRTLKLLEEGKGDAEFSKTLATIHVDAPIKFKLPKKSWKDGINIEEIEGLFEKYEFRMLPNRLRKLLGIEEKQRKEKSKDLSENEEEEYAIKMWLVDSEKTNASHEEILQFAKTDDWKTAKKTIDKLLSQDKELIRVWEEIEKPIIGHIHKMEKNGILVDKKFFKELSEKSHKQLDQLEAEIHKLAGEEFNIRSPKQLSDTLFNKMQLPTKGIKKSAGGAYSTNVGMLEKLRGLHPIIEKIMQYREDQKLLSTYIDVIPALVSKDGRLHAEFVQHGTTTGRFSSNNPNMQNMPIRSEAGRNIRNGFVADKGFVLASFDYSQIELRALAILSGDENLINIFKEGKDVHSSVASYIFGVKEDKVNKDMRRVAKVVNFGIIYGMGVRALAKNIDKDIKEAERFYNNFFASFPGVEKYLEEIKEFARENGYTETLFGRKRMFANISSRIPFIRAMAERMAINAPIQGTATADIMKLGLRFAMEDIKKAGIEKEVLLLLQIHDELVFEVKADLYPKAEEIIKNAMEGVLERSFLKYKSEVPILVESEKGNRWGEMR